jgi:hypothetical protein
VGIRYILKLLLVACRCCFGLLPKDIRYTLNGYRGYRIHLGVVTRGIRYTLKLLLEVLDTPWRHYEEVLIHREAVIKVYWMHTEVVTYTIELLLHCIKSESNTDHISVWLEAGPD